MIFGHFWGTGGSYPGGKNVPLPILHHFPPSKRLNTAKKTIFYRNTGFFLGWVGGRSPKIHLQMAGLHIRKHIENKNEELANKSYEITDKAGVLVPKKAHG